MATSSNSAHGIADQATDSDAFEYTARAGFAASGVLHLLIGYIILRLAFTGVGGNADQSGALATLGSQTGGKIVLWAAAAGLVALGLWRIAEAVIGAKPGDIAETVLLPGDPYRAKWAAETFLKNPELVNEVRGMLGFTGTWKGKPVTIHGSGMGMPSLSIYVNELILPRR